MNFWSKKRVTVTGGAGFLGSFLIEKLKGQGCRDIFVPRSSQYDLVDMDAVKQLYKDSRPDIVIHDGHPAHEAGKTLRPREARRPRHRSRRPTFVKGCDAR